MRELAHAWFLCECIIYVAPGFAKVLLYWKCAVIVKAFYSILVYSILLFFYCII